MNNQRSPQLYKIFMLSFCMYLLTSFVYNDRNNADTKFYEQAMSYHTKSFYFDKDPPFPKLIYSIITKFFSVILSHQNEENNRNYVFYCSLITYKILSSVLMSLTHSVAFKTLVIFCSSSTAIFTVTLLIFENYLHYCVTIKVNFSFLLFFLVFAVYFFILYKTHQKIKYLYATGLLLSAGLATDLSCLTILIPIIIILTIDLFYLACDNKIPLLIGKKSIVCMLCHYLICFVITPAIFYVGIFYVHITNQTNYTNEASIMSLHFQGQLLDNYLEVSDKYIIDRSLVTLVNIENKVYIKSENKTYSKGSQQQIVYAEDYKDENSIWKIIKIHVDKEPGMTDEKRDFFVKSGDYVKLVHVATNKYLHSHNIEAENSNDKKLKEVSGYGDFGENITDDNDFWVLNSDIEYIMTRLSAFSLKHVKTGNFLGVRSTTTLKTDDRHEVYSSGEGRKKFRYFVFEDNKIDSYHKKLVKDTRINEKIHSYEPLTFIQKFIEIHKKMIATKKEHNFKTSKAYTWPFTKGELYFYEPVIFVNNHKNTRLYILERLTKVTILKKILFYIIFIFDLFLTNYKRFDKIENNMYLRGNDINWYLSLLVFVFPMLWIFNEACKHRHVKLIHIKPQILYIFFIYVFSYLLNAIAGQEDNPIGYFLSFYFSMFVSGYLISLANEKFMHVIVALSLSSFCKNICFLLK